MRFLGREKAVIAVIVAVGVLVSGICTWTRIQQEALPSLSTCWDGSSLRPFDKPGTPYDFFLLTDESDYLFTAQQLATGAVATDSLGAFFAAAAAEPFNAQLAARSPLYRTAYFFRKVMPRDKPLFVSYRSIVFPALGAPILRLTGCNSRGLLALRYETAVFRLLLVVAAALLAFALTDRLRLPVVALTVALVATDAQLNEAATQFMADVPGTALFLFALLGVLALGRGERRNLLALGVGLLAGVAALMKFELVYVFPLALLLAVGVAPQAQRASLARRSALVLISYGLVLGAYAARNHALTGAWFITSKDTINLFIGNNNDAPARHFRYGFTAADVAELKSIITTNAGDLARFGPEIAMRRYFQQRVIALVIADPFRLLRLFAAKLNIFLHSGGYVHYPLLGPASGFLTFALMAGAIVAALLQLLCRRRLDAVVPASYLGLLALVSLVFFEPRYMTHLFPLAVIICLTGLARLAPAPLNRS